MKMLTCVVLFFFAVLGQAQKISVSTCPRTHVVHDFDISKYLGKWYEIAKYPNRFQSGRCTEANYGPVNALGQVRVLNKEVQRQQIVGVRGYAIQNRSKHGDLKVYLRVPFVGQQMSTYDVLDTDYENYALVHACRQFQNFAVEFAWVLGRSRNLTAEHKTRIQEVAEKNGLDTKTFRTTQQDNCTNLDGRPYRPIA